MMQFSSSSYLSLSKLAGSDSGALTTLRNELRSAIDAAVPAPSRAEFRRTLDRIAELEAECDARLLDFERDRLRRLAELEQQRKTGRATIESREGKRPIFVIAGLVAASIATIFAGVGWFIALLAGFVGWTLIAFMRREKAHRALQRCEARWADERDELDRIHRETAEKAIRSTNAQITQIAERWSSVLPQVLPYEERLGSERRRLEAIGHSTPIFWSLAA